MKILKYVPLSMSIIYFIFIMLLFGGIYLSWLAMLAAPSVLTLIHLYFTSYIFLFCKVHRVPLHYITMVQGICIIDSYIGIPLSTAALLIIHIILFMWMIYNIRYLLFNRALLICMHLED